MLMAIQQNVQHLNQSKLAISLSILFIALFFVNVVHALRPLSYVNNWIGYVATSKNNSVTSVSGEWTVQPALSSPTGRFSSQWIGIGGYGTNALVQIGTASCYKEFLITGCANPLGESYGAWFMFIRDTTANQLFNWNETKEWIRPMWVNPGDNIKASITFNESCNCWKAKISDNGGVVFTTDTSWLAGGPVINNSAEWIDERPGTPGRYYNLTNFVTANFRNSTAKMDDKEGNISSLNSTPVAINDGPGNDAKPLLLSGTNFEVLNFRVNNITVITSGQNYLYSNHMIIEGQEVHLLSSAEGGTGVYTYIWLEKRFV